MSDVFEDYKVDHFATVLAFDPGETTGWCVMRVRDDQLTTEAPRVPLEKALWFDTGQIPCIDENRGVSDMLDLWNNFQPGIVVHEDFIVDMNKIDQARHTLSPVRVMAKFEFGAFLQGLPYQTIVLQNRSPVKTTCTDDRLKRWNLYDRNSGPHARDAVRHAFYFLRNCRGNSLAAEEQRWKAWPHLFNDPMPEATAKGFIKIRKRPVGERIPGL